MDSNPDSQSGPFRQAPCALSSTCGGSLARAVSHKHLPQSVPLQVQRSAQIWGLILAISLLVVCITLTDASCWQAVICSGRVRWRWSVGRESNATGLSKCPSSFAWKCIQMRGWLLIKWLISPVLVYLHNTCICVKPISNLPDAKYFEFGRISTNRNNIDVCLSVST